MAQLSKLEFFLVELDKPIPLEGTTSNTKFHICAKSFQEAEAHTEAILRDESFRLSNLYKSSIEREDNLVVPPRVMSIRRPLLPPFFKLENPE